MAAKPIIWHVHVHPSSFVLKDRKLMREAFDVRDRPFIASRKWLLPFLMLRQAFELLFGRWRIVVVQFGGYHALLPALMARLLGRSCVIIAGGTDCVSLPSIGYGNFARQPLALITTLAFRWCSHIVPVHESLVRSMNTHQTGDPGPQGLLNHIKGLTTPITVVPNGYDATYWTMGNGERDIDLITVTAGDAASRTFILKGIDLFIAAARELPHLRFVVVGLSGAEKVSAPPNVAFEPTLPGDRLRELYQRTRFYAQLSLSEGFPNAPCEAMLCGCVPIVTPVGAMPDIVGGMGGILHERSNTALAALVLEQLRIHDPSSSQAFRSRIANNYTEVRRGRALLEILQAL